MIVADAGYRTPAIAHELLENEIEPLFPYKSPMTKDGFFRKYEYVYDEGYDCCLCPENQILSYRTTNRDGYREYQSCPEVCAKCPSIHKCTESKNPCEGDHASCLGKSIWKWQKISVILLETKRFMNWGKKQSNGFFGNSKGAAWISLYPVYWKMPGWKWKRGTYICLHESEKTWPEFWKQGI